MATLRLFPVSSGLLRTCIFMLAGFLTPLSARALVQISEFQADNADTIQDEDGANSDWIEIYNPDHTAVNLAGCTLTDNPALPARWTFPAVSVEPGGVLLVWASGKDRRDPGLPLHTNFSLAAKGGYLALRSPTGTVLTEFAPYPDQPEDRSYGSGRNPVDVALLRSGAAGRVTVPTAAIPGWEQPDFDDSGWAAAATGIGYDRSITSVNYLPLLGAGGNVESAMYQKNGSCYIRVPFQSSGAALVVGLALRVKYDDGFAMWLNGVRLDPPAASAVNAPASLAWNALAVTARSDFDAITFQTLDLSGQKGLLRSGRNVLAIQAMNQALNSSDLLMVPELDSREVTESSFFLTGYFPKPTPGQANLSAPFDGFTDAPDFSVKRGFYTAPQSLTLTSKTPGAEIRYTTNGNTPDQSTGTLYTGPLAVSKSQVIRARAFLPDWAPSTVKSHTFVFAAQTKNQSALQTGFPTTWGYNYNFLTGTLNPASPARADYAMLPGEGSQAQYAALIESALTQTLPVVSLATDIPGLFGIDGIYSNGRLTDKLEVPVSMEYFTPGQTAAWQEDAGLRIHGGDAPLEHPKKPFRVYFRKTYGKGNLEFPLYPGSAVEKFDVLQFRGGGHDGWAVPFGSLDTDLAQHATYMRDRFLRKTELDMGRLSPRGRYVHLYLNGLYWGVYDLHEVPNKDYFADHLGGKTEEWDVLQNPRTGSEFFGVIDGETTAMDELLSLCRPASNLINAESYAAVRKYIDPDEFADHMIVQMWAGQNDWMGPVFRGTSNRDASRFFNKNWDTGRCSRGDGQIPPFYFNVWDAEISMGSHLSGLVFSMRNTDFDHTRVGTPLGEIARIAGTPGPPAEIYHALRQNPAFRMRMADRLQKHFFHAGVMTPEANRARWDALSAELELPMIAESARWGDVNSGDPVDVTFTRDTHWRSEVEWMRTTYMGGRNDTLLSQFAAIGIWPAVRAPEASPEGGVFPGGVLLKLRNVNAGGTIYYTLDGSDPMLEPNAAAGLLTGADSGCRWRVPVGQTPGNLWKAQEDPGDLSEWHSGPAALGYDESGAFLPYIAQSCEEMRGVNASVYMRVPFTVTEEQKTTMTRLLLTLRYDDGAFVHLNGSVPLLRLNAPVSSPFFTDTATEARASALTTVPQTLDLTEWIPLLTTDRVNVLAIQGLNVSAADGDFLLAPELSYTTSPSTAAAAGALEYTGGLRVSGRTRIKARVLQNGAWSPLLEETFSGAVPATAANLVISEFCYHPDVPAAETGAGFAGGDFEFIELLNVSGEVIDLRGLQFEDGIAYKFEADEAVLAGPGGRVLLAANPAALALRFPGVTVAGTFSGSLSNGGERLRLVDASGGVIADVTYDDAAPWPEAPDESGFSLVLIQPETRPDAALAVNWRASALPGGTPGGADADSYAAWAARNGVAGGPAESGANGVSNALTYAFGAGVPPVLEVGLDAAGSGMLISWQQNRTADDVRRVLRTSDNLREWTMAPAVTVQAITDSGAGIDRVTVRLPVAPGRIFVQLAVTFDGNR